MKIKCNSDRIAVAGWSETTALWKEMGIPQFELSLERSLMFNTNKSLKKDKLYAFIFYQKQSKNIIDRIYTGKVEEVRNCVNMPRIKTYDFIFKDEVNDCIFNYSGVDNKPASIILQSIKIEKTDKEKFKT